MEPRLLNILSFNTLFAKKYPTNIGTTVINAPYTKSITPCSFKISTKPAPASAPAPSAGGQGSIQITAPMPGTVLSIKASVGQAVKKGEPVVILEAMKMENEIVAPQDGTIASVNATQGASVNNGDLLLTMN